MGTNGLEAQLQPVDALFLRGLNVRNDEFSAFVHHHKSDLVAGLDVGQKTLVFGGEHHGHTGHVQVLDVAMFDRDLAAVLVDLLDFTVGHGCRHLCRRHLAGIRRGLCKGAHMQGCAYHRRRNRQKSSDCVHGFLMSKN